MSCPRAAGELLDPRAMHPQMHGLRRSNESDRITYRHHAFSEPMLKSGLRTHRTAASPKVDLVDPDFSIHFRGSSFSSVTQYLALFRHFT